MSTKKNYLLHVHVGEGVHLLAADANGLSDPYCILSLGALKQRTRTVPRCLSPMWDQRFTFPVFDFGHDFELVCWDRDRYSRDDFLGRATVDLSRLASAPSMQAHVWLPLYGRKGDRIMCGHVNVKLALRETFDDERKVLRWFARHPEVVALQQSTALRFRAREIPPAPVRVAVATWNVGAARPPDALRPWLADAAGADVVAVCSQRCKYKARKQFKSLRSDWITSVLNALGPSYSLVARAQCGDTWTLVFVEAARLAEVSEITTDTKQLPGLSSAAAVSLRVRHTRLCFAGVHLDPAASVAHRNAHLGLALNDLSMDGPLSRQHRDGLLGGHFDHLFVAGSLGYPALVDTDAVANAAAGRGAALPPQAVSARLHRMGGSLTTRGSMIGMTLSAALGRLGGGGADDDGDGEDGGTEAARTAVATQAVADGNLRGLFAGDGLAAEMRLGNVALMSFTDSLVGGSGGGRRNAEPSHPPTAPALLSPGYMYSTRGRAPHWADRVLHRSAPGGERRLRPLGGRGPTAACGVCTSPQKPVLAQFEVDAVTLPPARDRRVGQCSVAVLRLAARDLTARADGGAPGDHPDDTWNVSLAFDGECLDSDTAPVRTKSRRGSARPAWDDREVPELRLRSKFNSKARLQYERLSVTAYDGDHAFGTAVLSLGGIASAEAVLDDVFDEWRAHFSVEFALEKDGFPVGTVSCTLQVIWAGRGASAGGGAPRNSVSVSVAADGSEEVLGQAADARASSPLPPQTAAEAEEARARAVRDVGRRLSGAGADQLHVPAAAGARPGGGYFAMAKSRSAVARIAATANAYRLPLAGGERKDDDEEDKEPLSPSASVLSSDTVQLPPPPPPETAAARLRQRGTSTGSAGSAESIPPPPPPAVVRPPPPPPAPAERRRRAAALAAAAAAAAPVVEPISASLLTPDPRSILLPSSRSRGRSLQLRPAPAAQGRSASASVSGPAPRSPAAAPQPAAPVVADSAPVAAAAAAAVPAASAAEEEPLTLGGAVLRVGSLLETLADMRGRAVRGGQANSAAPRHEAPSAEPSDRSHQAAGAAWDRRVAAVFRAQASEFGGGELFAVANMLEALAAEARALAGGAEASAATSAAVPAAAKAPAAAATGETAREDEEDEKEGADALANADLEAGEDDDDYEWTDGESDDEDSVNGAAPPPPPPPYPFPFDSLEAWEEHKRLHAGAAPPAGPPPGPAEAEEVRVERDLIAAMKASLELGRVVLPASEIARRE